MKKILSLTIGSIIGLSSLSLVVNAEEMKSNPMTTKMSSGFTVPKLNYDYNALEPYIDAKTMDIHLNKHHKGYVDKLNKAIKGTDSQSMTIEQILANISKYPDDVRNNAGGHWNHSFFWQTMTPKPKSPSKVMVDAISKDFGSLDEMKTKFNEAGAKRFGSGWVWLIKKDDGKLEITSTPNQDNPLMDNAVVKGKVIIACDIWEHAYYLKYQNKRPDYLKAFWNVVDWQRAEILFNQN